MAAAINIFTAEIVTDPVLGGKIRIWWDRIVGFVGIGVSLVLSVLALRHLGTARTSAYFSLAGFIGALLAVGLLHDAVPPTLALAGLLMAGRPARPRAPA